MLFLLTDSPQKVKLEKSRCTLKILFHGSPSSAQPQLKRICFFIKKTKETTIVQQVTGRNTPNLVLPRMQGHFLKIPSLKKILEFQD